MDTLRLCVVASLRPSRYVPYSISGATAAATLAGSVHGVVVQITSSRPLPSSRGKVR